MSFTKDDVIRLLTKRIEDDQEKYDGMSLFSTQHLEWYIRWFDNLFSSNWKEPHPNDPNHIFWKDGLSYFQNFFEKEKLDRFTTIEDRKVLSPQILSLTTSALSNGIIQPPTWKGKPMLKTPNDLTLIQMILWELKPKNVLYLGTWNGVALDYIRTLCHAFDLDTQFLSFDILNDGTSGENVWVDNQDIRTYEVYENRLKSMKGPTLLIEDSHVNIKCVLDYLFKFMKSGDYLMVEDIQNQHSPKYQEFFDFYVQNDDKLFVDNHYVDYFGINQSSCGTGILKVK